MSVWTYSIADDSETPEDEAPFDAEETIARYRNAAIALLPPGRAIAKSLTSGVSELLEGLSVEYARVHEQALILYRNLDPSKAVELLSTWEEALGLPGPCVTTPSTVTAERQGAITAKLRGRVTHAQSVFEDAAEDLGYADLEFTHYAPFEAGASAAGDACYGDEWANVVHIDVPVGDQTADDELVCTFDELRRAHGFLDIVLEGPMGATRTHIPNYLNDHVMSATYVLADVADIELKYSGFLSLQTIIDNGSGGAPADTPVGVWQLWISSDGTNYSRYVSSAITTELALIAPNGNNVVSAVATFTGVPGQYVKPLYIRTSGGGTDAKVTMHVTTW